MKYLYAILIAAALFGFYVWAYKANHNTPVPEGCENLRPDCEACGIADCAIKKDLKRKES